MADLVVRQLVVQVEAATPVRAAVGHGDAIIPSRGRRPGQRLLVDERPLVKGGS